MVKRGSLLTLGGVMLSLSFALPAKQPASLQHGEKSQGSVADAGGMFEKQCASCHIAPDLRFKPDKAWLGQIRETA